MKQATKQSRKTSKLVTKKPRVASAKRAKPVSPEQAVRNYFRGNPRVADAGPIRLGDTASGRGLIKFSVGASRYSVRKAG